MKTFYGLFIIIKKMSATGRTVWEGGLLNRLTSTRNQFISTLNVDDRTIFFIIAYIYNVQIHMDIYMYIVYIIVAIHSISTRIYTFQAAQRSPWRRILIDQLQVEMQTTQWND